MTKKWLAIALLALGIATQACSGDDDDDGEENVDVEGCEHLQDGPSTPLVATSSDTGAPAIDTDHMRYDVTLIGTTGTFGGFVSFAAAEEAEYVFFLGTNIPLELEDSSGTALGAESVATSSPECPEIQGRYLYDLTVGTWFLNLGPAAATSVSIVAEEAGHAHEH